MCELVSLLVLSHPRTHSIIIYFSWTLSAFVYFKRSTWDRRGYKLHSTITNSFQDITYNRYCQDWNYNTISSLILTRYLNCWRKHEKTNIIIYVMILVFSSLVQQFKLKLLVVSLYLDLMKYATHFGDCFHRKSKGYKLNL